MESLQKQISFPEVENLDLAKVHKTLGAIISDESASKLFRSDARKLIAVLRNLSRNLGEPSLLTVLLSIAGFSFGRPVSNKIVSYTSTTCIQQALTSLVRWTTVNVE